MPRIVTETLAVNRGAKRHDGSAYPAPQSENSPESDTITKQAQVSQVIDTTPIANEVSRLASVIGATICAQADTIDRIANKQPQSFEFVVTERDVHGRIVKMTAKKTGA